MKQESMEVVVGRMRLKAPVWVDAETTQRVVNVVNARLDEIEKRSDRVDSHAFALIAAMSFAFEFEQAKLAAEAEREQWNQTSKQEILELQAELSRLVDRLRDKD